jgi:hypothetical protein
MPPLVTGRVCINDAFTDPALCTLHDAVFMFIRPMLAILA